MQHNSSFSSLKLSGGGLLHSLMIRLNLQAPDDYRFRRRIILLVGLCWLPLLILTLIEGTLFNRDLDISFLIDPIPYVRFFITLPILIISEALIDPLIAAVISSINNSGIISRANQKAYDQALDVLGKRIASQTAEISIIALIYVLAVVLLMTAADMADAGGPSSWMASNSDGQYRVSYAGIWFYLVSSPILLVLLFRWLWRIANWCEFLFRVSRIKLELQPAHPDHAGGLGFLRNSQNAFVVIFFAFATMLSASIAQKMLFTGTTLSTELPVVTSFIIVSLLISTLPLLFFTRQLIIAKRRGRIEHGALGYRLSRAFDEKWASPGETQAGEKLLQTADASTVCDYSTVYDIVKNMQFVPVSLREYVTHALILAIPFLPLVFIEIPFTDVVKRLVDTLI